MTTKPEPTLKDCLWAIAKAERTSCGWTQQSSHIYDRCWCAEADCPCHSLSFVEVHGRVPRLPELREVCQRCSGTGEWSYFTSTATNPEICMACHGNGFVPRDKTWEDAWLWIRVLGEAMKDWQYEEQLEDSLWAGDILGVFQAATEVLGIEVEQQAWRKRRRHDQV